MTDTARLTGALAGRYAIERELGAGGMATVYLAKDLRHQRDVALKVLRPDLTAVLGGDRFLQEIRITARLDHPHILTLLDSGESDGFLWYVLPYIRGESLRARLVREKQLGLEEALAITRQIASALDYAHRQGVIHRDIKPENILLFEGEAMLADFGIALAVKEAGGNRLTETGLSLGTPQYMSPEQATGDRQLDARSDVYSLGAVLYEMLAGEPPHSGPTAQAVIAKLMTERPTRIRTVRDTVPEGIDNAVAKALAKVPADRFGSAADFASALAASSIAVRAPGKPSRRLVAAGSVVVALAAVLIGLLVARGGNRSPRAELPRVQLTSSGRAYAPIISPDGSQIAYVETVCDDRGGCTRRLVIRDLATAAEQPIVENAFWIVPLRYSPDGARILFGAALPSQGNGVFMVSRIGGPVMRLFGPADSVGGLDFLPGGDTLLVQQSGQLRSILVTSGQTVDNVRPTDSLNALMWPVSPDGRWIAFGRAADVFGSTTLLLADRRGRIADTLGARVWAVTPRWLGADALLVLSGDIRQFFEHSVLRVRINRQTGRIVGVDSVLSGIPGLSANSLNVSANGRDLVFGGSTRGESELWTLEARPGSAPRPTRRVLSSTSGLIGYVAADGQSILYAVESAGERGPRSQVFIEAFDAGPSRPVTPLLPQADLVDWTSTGYGRVFYVAMREGTARSRVTAYDLATGRSRPFAELPRIDGSIWARPGGGLLWVSPAADTLLVLDADGRPAHTISLPDSLGDLIGPGFSPNGSEVVLGFGQSPEGEAVGWRLALYRMTLEDGRVRLVRRIPATAIGSPTPMWGSDGWIRVELTTPSDPRWTIYRVRANDGFMQAEFTSPFDGSCFCKMSRDGRRWSAVRSGERSDVFLVRNFDRALR